MALEELKDRDIGKIGSPEQDQYEFELKMEVLGEMIKSVRKERHINTRTIGTARRSPKIPDFQTRTKYKECDD